MRQNGRISHLVRTDCLVDDWLDPRPRVPAHVGDGIALASVLRHVMVRSMRGARQRPDGGVVWEEEDYCSPPLAQERAAVLDEYFEDLRVTSVQKHEGWAQIRDLPPLFPELIDE